MRRVLSAGRSCEETLPLLRLQNQVQRQSMLGTPRPHRPRLGADGVEAEVNTRHWNQNIPRHWGSVYLSWPALKIKKFPPDLRAALQAEAGLRNDSIADVVRRHLCARYDLDCPPRSWLHHPRPPGPDLYIRLQPKLKRALMREAAETGVSVRSIILQELGSVYERTAA